MFACFAANCRFVFATAPCNIRDTVSMTILYHFAATYAQQRPVPLKVRLSRNLPRDLEAFSDLCIKHSVLEMYLWLSFRFPKYFIERDTCGRLMTHAIAQIEEVLMSSGMSQTYSYSDKYVEMRDKMSLKGIDDYPPEEFGTIRESAKTFIDEVPSEFRFVKPPHSTVSASSVGAQGSHSGLKNDQSSGQHHGRRQNFSGMLNSGNSHRLSSVDGPHQPQQSKFAKQQHRDSSKRKRKEIQHQMVQQKIEMLTTTS